MKIVGNSCRIAVSRCLRGRSGKRSRISSACRKTSSSGRAGTFVSASFGYFVRSISSVSLKTFQMPCTVVVRLSRLRSSAVKTFSQSYWST